MAPNVWRESDDDNLTGSAPQGADQWPELAGRISAGMTQDLSNLFAAMLAQVDLAQGSLEIQDIVGVDRDLEDLRLAVLRGSRLVEQMLAFRRGDGLTMRSVDLSRLCESAARLIRPLLPGNVTLRIEHDDSPVVRADAGALQQILMRLAIRSRDAMRGPGRIVIKVGTAELTRADFRRRGWGTPGRYGVITVTDDARSIAEADLARVFEPLLPGDRDDEIAGLLMVYALMKQHRGFVDVQSHEGLGTEVSLFFRPTPVMTAGARHGDGREPSATFPTHHDAE